MSLSDGIPSEQQWRNEIDLTAIDLSSVLSLPIAHGPWFKPWKPCFAHLCIDDQWYVSEPGGPRGWMVDPANWRRVDWRGCLASFVQFHDAVNDEKWRRRLVEFGDRYYFLATTDHRHPRASGFPWAYSDDCTRCRDTRRARATGNVRICEECDSGQRGLVEAQIAAARHFRAGIRILAALRAGRRPDIRDFSDLQWGDGLTARMIAEEDPEIQWHHLLNVARAWLGAPYGAQGWLGAPSVDIDSSSIGYAQFFYRSSAGALAVQFAAALQTERGWYLCSCGNPVQRDRAPRSDSRTGPLCERCQRARDAEKYRKRYAEKHPTRLRTSKYSAKPL